MTKISDPLDGYRISPEALERVGSGLVRPECVLAFGDGRLSVSHFGGGLSMIDAEGSVEHRLGNGAPRVGTNGLAALNDGSFLLANLAAPGGVWRLLPDGRQEPFLLEVEGRKLPPCNFVGSDRQGRIWITFSTSREPRDKAYRPDVADGGIVLVDTSGARLVAEGLGYTNEAILGPAGSHLYVNETFARRTSRFPLAPDGALGRRETFANYGPGTFPDGLAFDERGGLWVTSIVSNRLIRITPDGRQQLILEDCDPDWLEQVEQAFMAGRMGREHLDQVQSRVLKQLSSLAFGGPDLRRVYLGNLLGECIHSFHAPVAGLEPAHWRYA